MTKEHTIVFLPLRICLGLVFLMHGFVIIDSHPNNNLVTLWPALMFVVCGAAITLSLFARQACVIMISVILFSMIRHHAQNGFFYFNDGYEYHLTLLASTFTLMHVDSKILSLGTYLGFR